MKIRIISITLITCMLSLGLLAQDNNNDILLTINDKDITLGEFQRIYKKNSNIKSQEFDNKSLDDYLDLFINFKLKVTEAEALGYDTIPSFIKELAGYKKQLQKPYLTDSKADEKLIKEAYERLQYDVRASHILIKCDEKASPKDTLEAYNKIMAIRKKAMEGEDFTTLAKANSDDPSVKKNGGDLGYFTVFQMVYPFETAAFNTKSGEISFPIRTRFGYHIIKVNDKREAIGQIKVAHIMIAVPADSDEAKKTDAKNKAFAIYDSIQSGVNFSELAKRNSDDKGSAQRDGELPMFGTGRMVVEFEKAAFNLKTPGDVSEPIKTSFGWHIIRLLERKNIGTFEEVSNELKAKISRDSRLEISKKAILKKLKGQYKFVLDKNSLDDFIGKVNDDLYLGNWIEENKESLNNKLFYLSDTFLTQYDFAKVLKKKFRKKKDETYETFVNWALPKATNYLIEEYERGQLQYKYPDYKFLLQEYHDGILLFELTDVMVWSKAVKDTMGLNNFYNLNKENYKWGERYDGYLYSAKNESIKKKVDKLISKNPNITPAEILKKINKKSPDLIKVDSAIYSKGDNEIIDFVIWEIGNEKNIENQIKLSSYTGIKLEPQLKLFNEAKGLITADYQNFLEEEWVEKLREKYSVTVNKGVLKQIKF